MDQVTKVCARCQEEKDIEQFQFRSAGKDGRHYYCRSCVKAINRQMYEKDRENRKRIEREKYQTDEEHRLKRLAYVRQYNKDNKSRLKDVRLKKKYMISLEEYDAKLLEQGGVCAVCKGTQQGGRSLAVDHDHETGDVRGLLCSGCNTSLGLLREDEDTVDSLLTYIKSFKAAQAGT